MNSEAPPLQPPQHLQPKGPSSLQLKDAVPPSSLDLVSQAKLLKLATKRKRRGECVTCGIRLFKRHGVVGKRKPLTIPGHVEQGICLTCTPTAAALLKSTHFRPDGTLAEDVIQHHNDTNETTFASPQFANHHHHHNPVAAAAAAAMVAAAAALAEQAPTTLPLVAKDGTLVLPQYLVVPQHRTATPAEFGRAMAGATSYSPTAVGATTGAAAAAVPEVLWDDQSTVVSGITLDQLLQELEQAEKEEEAVTGIKAPDDDDDAAYQNLISTRRRVQDIERQIPISEDEVPTTEFSFYRSVSLMAENGQTAAMNRHESNRQSRASNNSETTMQKSIHPPSLTSATSTGLFSSPFSQTTSAPPALTSFVSTSSMFGFGFAVDPHSLPPPPPAGLEEATSSVMLAAPPFSLSSQVSRPKGADTDTNAQPRQPPRLGSTYEEAALHETDAIPVAPPSSVDPAPQRRTFPPNLAVDEDDDTHGDANAPPPTLPRRGTSSFQIPISSSSNSRAVSMSGFRTSLKVPLATRQPIPTPSNRSSGLLDDDDDDDENIHDEAPRTSFKFSHTQPLGRGHTYSETSPGLLGDSGNMAATVPSAQLVGTIRRLDKRSPGLLSDDDNDDDDGPRSSTFPVAQPGKPSSGFGKKKSAGALDDEGLDSKAVGVPQTNGRKSAGLLDEEDGDDQVTSMPLSALPNGRLFGAGGTLGKKSARLLDDDEDDQATRSAMTFPNAQPAGKLCTYNKRSSVGLLGDDEHYEHDGGHDEQAARAPLKLSPTRGLRKKSAPLLDEGDRGIPAASVPPRFPNAHLGAPVGSAFGKKSSSVLDDDDDDDSDDDFMRNGQNLRLHGAQMAKVAPLPSRVGTNPPIAVRKASALANLGKETPFFDDSEDEESKHEILPPRAGGRKFVSSSVESSLQNSYNSNFLSFASTTSVEAFHEAVAVSLSSPKMKPPAPMDPREMNSFSDVMDSTDPSSCSSKGDRYNRDQIDITPPVHVSSNSLGVLTSVAAFPSSTKTVRAVSAMAVGPVQSMNTSDSGIRLTPPQRNGTKEAAKPYKTATWDKMEFRRRVRNLQTLATNPSAGNAGDDNDTDPALATVQAVTRQIWTYGDKARLMFGELEGFDTLTQLMWAQMVNEPLEEKAVELFLALAAGFASSNNEQNENAADVIFSTDGANQAVEAVLFVLQSLCHDEKMVRVSCRLLIVLSLASQKNIRIPDGSSAGAVSVLIDVLLLHFDNFNFTPSQNWCLRALFHLCTYSSSAVSNKRKFLSRRSPDDEGQLDPLRIVVGLLRIPIEDALRIVASLSTSEDYTVLLLDQSVLSTCIEILREQKLPEDLIHSALVTVHNLYFANTASQEQRARHEVVTAEELARLAYQCAQSHRSSLVVSTEAISLIVDLVASGDVNREGLSDIGIIPFLSEQILEEDDVAWEQFHEEATHAMLALSIDCEPVKQAIRDRGTMSAVVCVAQLYEQSPAWQENVCNLIASVFMSSHAESHSSELEAILIVCRAMTIHEMVEHIQDSGVVALRNLSSRPQNKEQLMKSHAADLVFNAISNFEVSRSIGGNGCLVLWNCGYDGSTNPLQAQILISKILDLMRAHLDDIGFLQVTLSFLLLLLLDSTDSTKSFRDAGGVEVLTCVMVMHRDTESLVVQSCEVFASMSFWDEFVPAIVDGGGVLCILDTIREAHLQSTDILRAGSLFLANAVIASPDLCDEVSSIIAVLLETMRDRMSNADFQAEACRLIWALASLCPSARATILSLNGVAVIMATLEKHSTVKEVQTNALEAFHELATTSPAS